MNADPLIHFLPGLPGGPSSITDSVHFVECMYANGVRFAINLVTDPSGGAFIPEWLVRIRKAEHLWRSATRNRFRAFRWKSSVILPLHATENMRSYFDEIALGETGFLPITFSRGHITSDDEKTYAHLLSFGIKPLLVWDPASLAFWNQGDFDRVCSLPKTVHLLSYSYFSDPAMTYPIDKLLSNNANVILGSGCNSADTYRSVIQEQCLPEMRFQLAYLKRISTAILSHGFFG